MRPPRRAAVRDARHLSTRCRCSMRYFPLPGLLGERLFAVFDRKKNGVIDWEEFICGLALCCRGTPAQKAHFIFDMFNLAGDDGVSHEELETMLCNALSAAQAIISTAAYEEAANSMPVLVATPAPAPAPAPASVARPAASDDLVAHVRQLVNNAFGGDTNPARKLSLAEFQQWLSKNPFVLESIFGGCLAEHERRLRSISDTMRFAEEDTDEDNASSKAVSEAGDASPAGSTYGTTEQHVGRAASAMHADISGYLIKRSTSNPLRPFVRRYYMLKDDYLYKFSVPGDFAPQSVYHVLGCYVRAVEPDAREPRRTGAADSEDLQSPRPASTTGTPTPTAPGAGIGGSGALSPKADRGVAARTEGTLASVFSRVRPTRWAFELVAPNNFNRRVFYAESPEERDRWIEALETASKVRYIEDYYDVYLRDVIGRGAFATVYRGRHKESGSLVAVKVINKANLRGHERPIMMSEVAILKVARHPNIVSLREVFDTQDALYICMELCTGGELLQRLLHGPLTELDAKPIVRQVLSGVQYLHDLGVIHRDLKPSNLLFATPEPDALLKIVDFGYSKLVRPTDSLSDQGGTLKYWAPEMVNGLEYNRAVDMWSIGILIYVILCGQFPFQAQSEQDLLRLIALGRYNTASEVYVRLSQPARQLIQSLLRVDPSSRLTATQALQHPWLSA